LQSEAGEPSEVEMRKDSGQAIMKAERELKAIDRRESDGCANGNILNANSAKGKMAESGTTGE
jgi:hypothetical protein